MDCRVLRGAQLIKSCHFCPIEDRGKIENRFIFLVMKLIGTNLWDLRVERESMRFTLNTSLKAAEQCLICIEELHRLGFLHRDIKPGNFAIGRPEANEHHIIYMLDFGLCRKFQEKDKDVRVPREVAPFRGTTRYAPIAAMKQLCDGLLDSGSDFLTKNITRIATWNVHTLNQNGRLAQLLQEFNNYRLDILGLSKVRWTGSGCFSSANKTILFSGCEGRHERGVGFVLNKRAAKTLVGRKPVDGRIIRARFSTKHIRITVMQVYAPTDNLKEDLKNGLLQDTIDEAPRQDLKIVLGDFNAQLGGDGHEIERTIGPFASSEHLSDNGERLISFCVCNYLFKTAETSHHHETIAVEKLKDPVVANSFILELRNRFELLRNTNDIKENCTDKDSDEQLC
ncbi:endonuclease/exonuclease/phosphatase family protein [Ancylostoma caninum]|uniref:Endonuclease/exonuclease/phosphatase family protein n=1 Tax=Ancylostoma caninum TaxID=29170 RepID=A0A368GYL9_ANCCA|nr:endonuclease/exonuclease/phosphatase family protein [Ancylostoma caninum]